MMTTKIERGSSLIKMTQIVGFMKWVFILQVFQVCVVGKQFLMQPGRAITLTIPSHGQNEFSVASFYNNVTLMLQLHSQKSNITLCSSPVPSYASCKIGTDVGMYAVTKKTNMKVSVLWYAKINSTHNETSVVAYLHVFQANDPFPGGCNEVFNLENDPNIQLTYHGHQSRILFQWAKWLSRPDCDSTPIQTDLVYDVYVYYMDASSLGLETFLDSISRMMLVENIVDNGQKIITIDNTATTIPDISVASEGSRGTVYAVIVTSNQSGLSAPYVTAVSYNCDFSKGECSGDMSAGKIIVIIFCFLAGAYMLLLGHRMFHISQFVFGYMVTFMLVFLLMHMSHTVGRSVIIGIAACMGVIGGFLCLMMWYGCFFPIASVLVPGLCAGYLLAATIFFTPFGNIEWWESNENYILAFICLILLYAVLLMAYSKFLSILSSSLIGSYLLLLVIGIPLRSSLSLVYLYTEYRQTEKGFEDVKLVPPMTTIDITLLSLWPVVLIMGIVFQYYRERDRPAFERFDLKWNQLFRSHSPQSVVVVVDGETESENSDGNSPHVDKRERLMHSPHRTPPSYQAVQESPRESPRSRIQKIC